MKALTTFQILTKIGFTLIVVFILYVIQVVIWKATGWTIPNFVIGFIAGAFWNAIGHQIVNHSKGRKVDVENIKNENNLKTEENE